MENTCTVKRWLNFNTYWALHVYCTRNHHQHHTLFETRVITSDINTAAMMDLMGVGRTLAPPPSADAHAIDLLLLKTNNDILMTFFIFIADLHVFLTLYVYS